MLNELAHFSLNIALGFAVLGTIIPLLGATLRRSSWMQLASVFALLQFLLVAFAFGVLTLAFVTSDFSLRLVVLNSHTLKPMIYKIAGVWGNHEGSLLLWVLILTFFAACAALFRSATAAKPFGAGFGGAKRHYHSLSGLCFADIQSVHPRGLSALQRAGAQSLAARSGFGLSSAVFISRICWPFDHLLFRDSRFTGR